ncbi:MAG TPA: protease complex subunit PrcB family protein [Vicinamibacterales bacterium]
MGESRDALRRIRARMCLLLASAATAAMLAVSAQAMSQSPAPANAGFRTVERGSQSNIDRARQVVIRSAAEWTTFWRTHNFDKPAPHVDFDKEMVVGVFMGSRQTGGYSVTITSVAERDGSLVVTYSESSPRPGAMTAQVLTFPYHLVAVPKRSGDVKFEKT